MSDQCEGRVPVFMLGIHGQNASRDGLTRRCRSEAEEGSTLCERCAVRSASSTGAKHPNSEDTR
jgi:hypothetical protein